MKMGLGKVPSTSGELDMYGRPYRDELTLCEMK